MREAWNGIVKGGKRRLHPLRSWAVSANQISALVLLGVAKHVQLPVRASPTLATLETLSAPLSVRV